MSNNNPNNSNHSDYPIPSQSKLDAHSAASSASRDHPTHQPTGTSKEALDNQQAQHERNKQTLTASMTSPKKGTFFIRSYVRDT